MLFRKSVIGVIGFVCGLFLIHAGGAVSQEIPSVKAIKATGKIVLDGKLNEKDWVKTKLPYSLSHYTSGAPAKEKTEFAVLYDSENLYFGVICHESRMEKTVSVMTGDDKAVYLDDSLELFIAPYEVGYESDLSNDRNFFHFCLNMPGYRYGDCLANRGTMVPWSVKTHKEADKWVAEVAIPLKVLLPKFGNEAYWRLNVTRFSSPGNEYTSWAVTQGSFHAPKNFGKLTGIDVNGKFIGYQRPVPVVHPELDYKTSGYWEMPTAQSYKEDSTMIIPVPVKMEITGQDFVINQDTRIVLAGNQNEANQRNAQEIKEEIKTITGLSVPIVSYVDYIVNADYSNCILLGEKNTAPVVAYNMEKILGTDTSSPGSEGYILKVNPKMVLIMGTDAAGTFYGVQSLKQLIKKNSKENKSYICGVSVWDEPYFKERWVHFFIDKTSPVSHVEMMKKIFAKYKYNRILMQIDHGIKWKSHPEIWTDYALDPKYLKDIVKEANDRYMKVVPMVATLGHSNWMFYKNNNLDFVENTTRYETYCPLNPKSYEFVHSIFDEIIDIFHPETIHIGHDEHDLFLPFPTHPECKKIGNSELYYMDTIYLYQYLRMKGIKTMVWADIIQKPDFKWMAPLLPRDIIMVDWRYRNDYYYPGTVLYQDLGFPVIGGTWYRPANISRFTQFGAERKIDGMMYTTWAGYDKNDSIVEREYRQVMGYITQADLAWNPRLEDGKVSKNEPITHMPYYVGKTLRETWYPSSTWRVGDKKGFALDLTPKVNFQLTDSKEKPGFAGYGKGIDLSGVTSEANEGQLHLMDNIHYRLSYINKEPMGILLKGQGKTASFPSTVTNIPVNRKAHSLNFLHTTLYETDKDKTIGQYTIHYADGSKVAVPLVYGPNIACWSTWMGYLYGNAVYCGNTPVDTPVYLRSINWVNPAPNKEIQSIDFVGNGSNVSPLLLAVTGLE